MDAKDVRCLWVRALLAVGLMTLWITGGASEVAADPQSPSEIVAAILGEDATAAEAGGRSVPLPLFVGAGGGTESVCNLSLSATSAYSKPALATTIYEEGSATATVTCLDPMEIRDLTATVRISHSCIGSFVPHQRTGTNSASGSPTLSVQATASQNVPLFTPLEWCGYGSSIEWRYSGSVKFVNGASTSFSLCQRDHAVYGGALIVSTPRDCFDGLS